MRTEKHRGYVEVRGGKRGEIMTGIERKEENKRGCLKKKKNEAGQRSSGHCYATVFDFSSCGSSLSHSQLTQAFLFLHLCPPLSSFIILLSQHTSKRWK